MKIEIPTKSQIKKLVEKEAEKKYKEMEKIIEAQNNRIDRLNEDLKIAKYASNELNIREENK